jgi:hypothetical protein
MNVDTLILLALLTVGFWFWSASRVRAEAALASARQVCAAAGVQLLDGSVVFIGLRPFRSRSGWSWRWRYRYEYSNDGIGRRTGLIAVVGREVDYVSLPEGAGRELI